METHVKYHRGSEWRKWDLHFHTPSSNCHNNKTNTDQDIIDGLMEAGLAAVAITDHHTIDIEKIKNLQKLAADNITIFPGIEFRSELGGSNSVHFIGIFSEDCDIDDLWTKLKVKCNLTDKEIADRGGYDAICSDFKETAKLIHDCGGLVTVHAGKKCNSIEEIPNIDKAFRTLKKDLAKNSIDFLEVGNAGKEIEDYRNIVFPKICKELPIIICSDNHDINKYQTKTPCWIKADPTFKGLRQLLIEPSERVFIGEEPPKRQHIANNSTKYINKIEIKKTSQATASSFQEKWFNDTVPFSCNLTAIIGNKGSGKSALADIIGLLGNSKKKEYFSFLHKDKFKNKSENKAQHFDAEITWLDGTTSSKNLDDAISSESVERVKYIPQNFLETICNAIDDHDVDEFNKELRAVIFSHVGEAERLGKNSLDELITYKTEETQKGINLLKIKIRNINTTIIGLEEKFRPEYKKGLLSKLKQKEQELKSLKGSKPEHLKEPDTDTEKQKEISTLLTSIDSQNEETTKLECEIRIETEKKKEQTKKLALLDKLLQKIEIFETQYVNLKEELTNEYSSLNISTDDIIKIIIDKKPLDEARREYKEELKRINDLLDAEQSESLIYKKNKIEKKIERLQNDLDRPNKIYKDYLKKVEEWKRKVSTVIGDEVTTDSLEFYRKEIRKLKHLPTEIEDAKKVRSATVKKIFSEVRKLTKTYKTIYKPVQDFILNCELKLEQTKSNITFNVSIVLSNFKERFFSHISHGSAGSFCGINDGNIMLQDIIDKSSFEDESSVLDFLTKIINHLFEDQREDHKVSRNVHEQLLRDTTLQDLYDFIFSLEYLVPKYTLKWSGKELYQLSPGEKGTLLLIFYLLIDKNNIPLIIDQPEGNLDNETVFKILVPCIKEAKRKRQIIIVTHNPNLAVVCDAELIIYASLDVENKNKVAYRAGSIENPSINKKIVDILEGTQPAFKKRDSKYKSMSSK